MHGFNKFRAITVGFILMFIFVIAAMYSNTKDITEQKMKEAGFPKTQNAATQNYNNNNLKNDINNTTDNSEIEMLENRVEKLESTIGNLSSEIITRKNSELNCQIRGILDNGDVIPLSSQEAIEEANMNNREIVITCRVK